MDTLDLGTLPFVGETSLEKLSRGAVFMAGVFYGSVGWVELS